MTENGGPPCSQEARRSQGQPSAHQTWFGSVEPSRPGFCECCDKPLKRDRPRKFCSAECRRRYASLTRAIGRQIAERMIFVRKTRPRKRGEKVSEAAKLHQADMRRMVDALIGRLRGEQP